MKYLILASVVVNFFIAAPVFAGNSAALPISVKIVNLSTMPLAEAMAFCEERNMACPVIRAKYARQDHENHAPSRGGIHVPGYENATYRSVPEPEIKQGLDSYYIE